MNERFLNKVKIIFMDSRRIFRSTPTQQLMRELNSHNIDIKKFRVLDLFAGHGAQTTKDTFHLAGSLEAWEINPAFEQDLRRNLPGATVKIVDTYYNIKLTDQKYDMVIADTWVREFEGHCEHFELFPDIFRILKPFSILIFNVMSEIYSPGYLTESHKKKRGDFYNVSDPYTIPANYMAQQYDMLAKENDFCVKWWVYKDRHFLYQFRKSKLRKRLGFLALALNKK
jgi:hypothetical protein